MSQVRNINDIKAEKINQEIKELREEHEKAINELEVLVNRMDLKSDNGGKTTEQDIEELFNAMAKVAKANHARREANLKNPNRRQLPILYDMNILEETSKLINGKIVPQFVLEEELDQYMD